VAEITTCIMNIAFTAFAVYGIFTARKWHAAAKRLIALTETAQEEIQEKDGE